MSFDLKISNRDLVISSDGDLQKVQNTDKLIQDILKISLTALGSNPFCPWYGSAINQSLIGMPLSLDFSSSVASSQLQNSLQTLQKLQIEQAKFQFVTPAEQLAAVKGIKISRSNTDPRAFQVIINAVSKALTNVNTGFNLVPGL